MGIRMRSLWLVALVGCRTAGPSVDDASLDAPVASASASAPGMVRAVQCAYVPTKLAAGLSNVSVGADIVGVAPGSGFCVFEVRSSEAAPVPPRVSGANVVPLPQTLRAVASGTPTKTVVRVYDLGFESTLSTHVARLRTEAGATRTADCSRVGESAADAKKLDANLRAAQQRFIDEGVVEDPAHGWAIAHVPPAKEARDGLGAACPALKVW